MQVFEQSNREFQHIHIKNYCTENSIFLDLIIALKFKWKFIKLCRFHKTERLWHFIEKHSKHLIKLKIIDKTTKHIVDRQLIELEVLRILQMDNYDNSNKKLKSLYFKYLVKLKGLISS